MIIKYKFVNLYILRIREFLSLLRKKVASRILGTGHFELIIIVKSKTDYKILNIITIIFARMSQKMFLANYNLKKNNTFEDLIGRFCQLLRLKTKTGDL